MPCVDCSEVADGKFGLLTPGKLKQVWTWQSLLQTRLVRHEITARYETHRSELLSHAPSRLAAVAVEDGDRCTGGQATHKGQEHVTGLAGR